MTEAFHLVEAVRRIVIVTRFLSKMAFGILVIPVLAVVLARDSAGFPQSPSQDSASSASPFVEADHLLQLGKFTEAIAQLEAMQNQTPPPKGLARELGIAYYKKSDYLNAILNLQKALNENPQ
ncbi:MAG: hypothetical protein WBL50_27080, partial [Candidatus Acidiferrum sp.]